MHIVHVVVRNNMRKRKGKEVDVGAAYVGAVCVNWAYHELYEDS
jgi:hypothetical protein